LLDRNTITNESLSVGSVDEVLHLLDCLLDVGYAVANMAAFLAGLGILAHHVDHGLVPDDHHKFELEGV
jgi:hypothetical protein